MKTRLFPLTAALFVFALAFVQAANRTWTGTNGTLWNDVGNWDVLPVPGSDALIFAGSNNTNTTNDFAVNSTFTGITILSTAPAFTLGGNAITLGGDVSLDNSTATPVTHTIDLPLVLNGNRNFGLTGTALEVNATITVNGVISDDGANYGVAHGAGTNLKLIFANTANTFGGAANLEGRGIVQVTKLDNTGNASSLGTGNGTSTIQVGRQSWDTTLEYVGSTASSTDRSINIGLGSSNNHTGGSVIKNSATDPANALVFTNAIFNVPVTQNAIITRNLTFSGNNTGNNTVAGTIQNNTEGTVSLNKVDAGKWILSGNNTYTGNTTLTGGNLVITGNNTALVGLVTINSNSVLIAGNNNALGTGNATLANTGAVLEIANGTTLAGNTLTVSNTGADKTLRMSNGADTAGYTGNIVINEGGGGNFRVQVDTGNFTLSGDISGTGGAGLTKNGNGTLTLSGNNSYTAATAFNAGQVNLNHANALGTGATTFGSNVTNIAVDNTSGSPIVLTSNCNCVMGNDTLTFGGSNDLDLGNGTFNLQNDLTKTLVLNGNRTLSIGTATSTRNGPTTFNINQGTGSGAKLVMDMYKISSSNVATQGHSKTINTDIEVTITGSVFNGNNFTQSLVKSGNGTLILQGDSTYNGTTTVNAGKLLVNGNNTAATGKVSVAANATLSGNGTLGGNTTVENNGILAFNLSTVPGSHDRLDITGNLAFAGNSTLTITTTGNATTTGNYTLVATTGGVAGSAPATLNLPSGWSANASISGNDLVLNVTSLTGASPANVTFTSAGQNVAESAGTAVLTVTATGATGDITANVTFDSGNSTATAGDIGGYTTQTVTLNATNSYTANVTVNITDDATPESNETAVFNLADLTGSAVLASPSAHTLTILANDSFAAWAAGYGLNGSLTDNFDGDKFTDGEEYAFDLDPTSDELGNVLASQTAISGGNVTMTLAFNGNSSKQDINYVVRRANNPGFTANTVVGLWNGTANWTTSNGTYFANETQSGAGDVKAINVNMSIPAATEPRQFLKVNIE